MKLKFFLSIGSLLILLFVISAGCTDNRSGSVPTTTATSATTPQAVAPAATDGAYTSNETLVAFVESAADYARARGAPAALTEFNNPKGSFVKGELYIYAYGFNGTTLAHPVSPEAVGKVREGQTGVFVREMGAAVGDGSGFYRFTYINPQHNRTLESKLGYGVKIDDTWWLGSGVYTGPVPQ